MKKLLLLLSFLLIGFGVYGAETLVYTLEPVSTGGNSSPHNNYSSGTNTTISGIGWNVTGNSNMVPWRIGGKNISGTDRKIYSTTKISDNISKIVITHGAASSITINSVTVTVSTSQNCQGTITSTLTPTFKANGDVIVIRPDGADWTNKFYTFTYNVTVSRNNNKFVEFVRVKFYKEDTPSCTSTVTITPIPAENGSFNLSETSVCGDGEGGTVTVTDIEPAGGYEID